MNNLSTSTKNHSAKEGIISKIFLYADTFRLTNESARMSTLTIDES
jgi:hypothetical protein